MDVVINLLSMQILSDILPPQRSQRKYLGGGRLKPIHGLLSGRSGIKTSIAITLTLLWISRTFATECPSPEELAQDPVPTNLATGAIEAFSEQPWRFGAVLAGELLAGDKLRCLPDSVAPGFKNPQNYYPNDAIHNQPDSGGVGNNCSSFAINEYGNNYYGGTPDGDASVVQARFHDPSWWQSQACVLMDFAFRFNPRLHAQVPRVQHGSSPQCPAGTYMIVPYKQTGGGAHVVRQLPSGQFSELSGPGGKLQLLYLKNANGTYSRITDYNQLPIPNTPGEKCAPICISPDPTEIATPPPPLPPPDRKILITRPPAKSLDALSGSWTVVTPAPSAKPVPYTAGLRCGPFTQRVFLAIGLPPGWFGNLIPGAPSGPMAMTLEVMSNLADTTANRDQFGYSGVNLIFAGKLNAASPNELEFIDFHDSLVPQVDRRTGVRIPQLLDPSKGVHFRIDKLDRNTMQVSTDWDSPCAKDLVFHRTRVIRGSPEIVK